MQIRIVRASTFHLWDRAFDSDCAPNDTYSENQPLYSEKVVGFLRVLRFLLFYYSQISYN
jgi:hypothetical protein